jgi:hypothetical protein
MLPMIQQQLADLEGSFDLVSVNDLLVPAVQGDDCVAPAKLFLTITAQPAGGFARIAAGWPTTKVVGSPSCLLPSKPALDESFEMTSFWLSEAVDSFEAPSIEAFVRCTEPVVAVAFGSAWGCDPYFSTDGLIEAARQAGVRLIIQDTGWNPGDASYGHAPDRVTVVGRVPYSWLFERVQCVVHHGGAGTISEALRAGCPSIALPQYGDHQYWAERLEAVGASPGTLLPDHVAPEALADLIDRAVHDRRYRAAADRIRRELDITAGLARACDHIERLAA